MSPIPAPAFDIFNVYFERIYDPTMHVALTFDGRIDVSTMREAAVRLVASSPYLRSRFADAELPAWEAIPEGEWERAFLLAPAGESMDLPPPPLDVRAGPQIRVSLYQREEGDQVIITCHHGFCDAAGAMTLAQQVFAVYRGILEDPDFRPATVEPYDRGTGRILALYSDEERRRALAEEEPFADRWRFPAERIGRGIPRIASRTLAPERLRRMKSFGYGHGATVNDVLIAAFFLAFREIRGDPEDWNAPRSVLTSADLRRRYPGCYDEGMPMNLSTAYEVTISMREGAGLEDIIGPVTAITSRRKAERPGLATILFYEGIMAGGMSAVRAFFDDMVERYISSGHKNPVFANLGIFDPEDYLPVPGRDGAALGLVDIQYIPCVCWPYGFLMTASTFRGRLTITAAYEEGPYATATVERFLGYVDGYLP
ncbi:MAG: condensation protein [Methanoculleus sp.]